MKYTKNYLISQNKQILNQFEIHITNTNYILDIIISNIN